MMTRESACDTTDQPLTMNRACECLVMSRQQIDEQLRGLEDFRAFVDLLADRPHLIAETAVFLGAEQLAAMQSQVDAIEAVTRLPGYQTAIRERDPIAGADRASNDRGLFMGYDFHLTEAGPRLIEVNTNAGGAFIMQALLSAVRGHVSPCVPERIDNPQDVEHRIVQMFIDEWRSAGRSGTPPVVVIVDRSPAAQYLYPDMRLAQAMLERHGILSVIAEPEELTIKNGRLRFQDTPVDLVYNRLTDFSLTEQTNATLREALVQDLAVISPSPLHHALYADKRNLALWQQSELLTEWGVPDAQRDALAVLPATETVSSAQDFWPRRKQLFFKPNGGFGGKATYRGSKLTRRVFDTIANGGYVAQAFIPPALRTVRSALMKFDVRLFTYAGAPLLAAARIYQGQATNFRTPGGGFAPVVYLP